MANRRITIYDIAEKLGVSASYVSRALNDHPLVGHEMREKVKKKALELNYKHNSYAANLRQGYSKTIGVIVPYIDHNFFSGVISGIEEVCFKNNYGLVICQSHENFQQESTAIDTLIRQNVDCIMISVSAETQSYAHIQSITEHNIELIQFDRCLDKLESHKVMNDNKEASFKAVMSLIEQGYKSLAFLGGPEHIVIYRNRKDGFLKAIKNTGLNIPGHFIADDVLTKVKSFNIAKELLSGPEPPDAFFTVSDYQSLGVLQAANELNINVPKQLGIFGFANEAFSEILKPSLSSVDQKSKEMGRHTAELYFKDIRNKKRKQKELFKKEIIRSEIIIRESSKRK